MKRLLILVVVLVVVLATVPSGGAAKGDAAAGKTVYTAKCASCHGKNGEGNKNLEKALKVPIRDLGSKEVQAKSDEQLAKESSEGVGKMRPVKGLSEQDVANVVAFIRSLKK